MSEYSNILSIQCIVSFIDAKGRFRTNHGYTMRCKRGPQKDKVYLGVTVENKNYFGRFVNIK